MNKRSKYLILIILITVLLFGFYYYFVNSHNEQIPVVKHDDVIEEVVSDIPSINYLEELNKLRNEYNNNDIVGVLNIENTSFNEIVMQSSDNDYYLNHTVYHESNWRGQTFLDFRVDINNSDKLIIYGHNSPNYVLPFKIFENYYDSNYLNEHKYLYLQTDSSKKIYEIFSVYVEVEDWTYYNKMNFIDKDDYYNHILELKNNSWYDTGIDVSMEDEILIIQTCSTHNKYKNYENKFLIIVAKRIDEFDK